MTKTKRFFCVFAIVLALALSAGVFAACGGGNDDPPEPTTGDAESIEVTTMPKTEFTLGEEFTAEGGVLTVTYEGGATETVSMTAEGVEITAPDMTTVGENKNVVVRYAGARTTYRISVTIASFTVSFSNNGEVTTEEVDEGEPVAEPETPVRDGYTFRGWRTAEAGGVPYDFSSIVTADFTLYAYWTDDSVDYSEVTFNYNNGIGGMASDTVVQYVAPGGTAVELVSDPVRTGYSFLGWFDAADGGDEFDFTTEITEDTTIYAQWERSSTEPQTYTFEVEDIILEDPTTGNVLTGPGASGSARGEGMLVQDDGTHDVSNGYFISYLYSNGIDLRFEIVSDMETTATLVVRMSAEGRDRTFDQDNYMVSVNGMTGPDYTVSITNVPAYAYEGVACAPFRDYVIGNIQLYEGRNYIDLVTNNNDGDAGSTRTASAPLIDCIKLTTGAVVTWNTSLGYPADNY